MARISGTAQGTQAPPSLQRGRRFPAIRHPPTPRFVYMYHPEQYTVIDGRVVPRLHQLAIQPGVGSVGGNLDPSLAISRKTANGWKLIPEDVDGEGTSYVSVYELREGALAAYARGGKDALDALQYLAFLPRWAQVWVGSDAIEADEEGYADWLLSLEERGVIPPPEVWVLDRLAERLRRAAHENAAKVAKQPGLQDVVDAETAAYQAVLARLDDLRAGNRKRRKAPAKATPPRAKGVEVTDAG